MAKINRHRKLRVVEVPKQGATMKDQAWGAMLAFEGPKCAAELVNGDRTKRSSDGKTLRLNRRRIRSYGYFARHLPANVKMPMWFALAIATLKDRPKSWLVEETTSETGTRFFRIAWLRKRARAAS